MRSDIRQKISPSQSRPGLDFSDAAVVDTKKVIDNGAKENKVSFKDLIFNSNDDTARERAAQKNGDGLRRAKSDEEFAKMMSDRLNKENLRKPQNNLDKDSFLKLFITQMQNQDPLNPDDSAEMAAQLAQFNGLEQMMNVNKNLEKMQADQSMSRGVSLLPFVGKEVKLANGKIRVDGTAVTKANVNLTQDAPVAKLEVRDGAGVVVASKDLGFLKKGEQRIEWDGKAADGLKVANGTYTLHVSGKDLNDQDVPIDVFSVVKINGIDFKESGGLFETDVGRIGIGEVVSVGTDGVFSETKPADKAPTDPAESSATKPPVATTPSGVNQAVLPPELAAMAKGAANAQAAPPPKGPMPQQMSPKASPNTVESK